MTRNYMQCNCVLCGRMGHGKYGKYPDCPVDPELFAALESFAAEHGRNWKSKLRNLWDTDADEGELRRARNIIGPRALSNVKYPR